MSSADTAPDPDESLLSAPMLARLSRLAMLSRSWPEAHYRGRRRLRRAGAGTEPVDTRPYEPGDDPRRIAWPAYARLERLLVRVVADEAPLRVLLIVDTSRSMALGGPGRPSKLVQASRIAAGLAAVALAHDDRVAAVGVAGEVGAAERSRAGRGALEPLLSFLSGLRADGETDLQAVATTARVLAGGRSVAIVVSDLLDPNDAGEAVRALSARGHAVVLVEVLDPSELDPPDLEGCELEDEETGELLELPLHGVREAYLEALARHQARLEGIARELGAPLLRARTDEPFDGFVARAIASGLLTHGGAA